MTYLGTVVVCPNSDTLHDLPRYDGGVSHSLVRAANLMRLRGKDNTGG